MFYSKGCAYQTQDARSLLHSVHKVSVRQGTFRSPNLSSYSPIAQHNAFSPGLLHWADSSFGQYNHLLLNLPNWRFSDYFLRKKGRCECRQDLYDKPFVESNRYVLLENHWSVLYTFSRRLYKLGTGYVWHLLYNLKIPGFVTGKSFAPWTETSNIHS